MDKEYVCAGRHLYTSELRRLSELQKSLNSFLTRDELRQIVEVYQEVIDRLMEGIDKI